LQREQATLNSIILEKKHMNANHARANPIDAPLDFPIELLDILIDKAGLLPESIVADIACGYGYASKLFLENDNVVHAVEPDRARLELARNYLDDYGHLNLLNADAIKTGIAAETSDYVIAHEMIHEQPRDALLRECRRILRPDGIFIVIFSELNADSAGFSQGLSHLFAEHIPDWSTTLQIRRETEGMIGSYFANLPIRARVPQRLAVSRAQTIACAKILGDVQDERLQIAVSALFEQHNTAAKVDLIRDFRLYFGPIA
jgi:SAM-dependent methyltransferase